MLKYLIGLSAPLLFSCSNYSVVRSSHIEETTEPKINPIESTKTISSKTYSVKRVEIPENIIADDPSFVKTNTLILPFLIFNTWNHKTDYIMGRKQLKSSLSEYIQNSFEIGLSQFGFSKKDVNPDFEIEIKVRKIDTRSSFTKSGFFYFVLIAYGYNFGGSKGPYQSEIILEINTKADKKIYVSEVKGESILTVKDFNSDIDSDLDRMSRALSFSINDAVSKYALLAPR